MHYCHSLFCRYFFARFSEETCIAWWVKDLFTSLYEGMGKSLFYQNPSLKLQFITSKLVEGLNVLISFLLPQSLKVEWDKSVSQMPECNINVFFFSPSKKKKILRKTADLVHHHNYFSSIPFIGKLSWLIRRPSKWWLEFNHPHQSSESIILIRPYLGCIWELMAADWARTLGFSTWVPRRPLEVWAWFSRQTHMSCHKSICCAAVERPWKI